MSDRAVVLVAFIFMAVGAIALATAEGGVAIGSIICMGFGVLLAVAVSG